MGAQGGKTAAQQAHMRALTGGSKIMKKVKKVGQKVNQAPAGADSEAGKFVQDLIANPTGAPVPVAGAKPQPGTVAGVAQPPVQQQPAQGVSPEASAAIANVQAQQGGRAGIAQRRRQAAKAKV